MWPRNTAEVRDPLAALEALRSQIGVVRVADTTALDDLGVATAICVRAGVTEPATTVTSGKGSTPRAARLGALAEALERFCAEPHGRVETMRARFGDLADALDPRTLILASWSRYTVKCEIEWCRGVQLGDGRAIWVPANAVFFPYEPLADEQLFAAHTTGLAAGASDWQAIRHALLECIERDHYTRVVATLTAGRLLPDGELACELRGRVTARGARLVLRDITGDFGVPTALAVIAQEGRAYRGCATRLAPADAARAAVLEAAQSRATFIQGSRDDLVDPCEAPVHNWFTEPGLVAPWRARALDNIDAVAARAIAVDLSIAGTSLSVVRVLLPGTEVWADDPDRCGERCEGWLRA